MLPRNKLCLVCLSVSLFSATAMAEWKVLSPTQERTKLPESIPGDAKPIKPGDAWPQDNQFRWVMGEFTIPKTLDAAGDKEHGRQSVKGKTLGMRVNCGDGGEVYVNGVLQSRYDNDHPALVLIAEDAVPGTPVKIAVQVYGRIQGGDKFDEATWVLVEPARANGIVTLKVDASKPVGDVPAALIGLSQGAGLADYEDATAAKLKEAGFKWFRMDNVFTNVVKKNDAGELTYDWTDFDRRLDFIVNKLGAEPIFAVSYMPIVLDAVKNDDRHSAPRDYGIWEDLCYRAAKHALDRGTRVPYWEVWNEPNTGWIVPGPQDTGTAETRALYEKALGKTGVGEDIIRRFEAYAKLYKASARGVLRADPKAQVGGPALASGPFEQDQYGFCANGRGFARGLMAWCAQEKLPLDFLSWHEYFHPSDIIAKEADAMHEYMNDYPTAKKSVKSLMITEWNEAWWPNRPQDHEVGSAYCGDCVIRAFIPKKVDRPCFFYVKQNDPQYRGDWSMLMPNNVPKPTYNMAKVFNSLSGQWLKVTGGDGDVCAVAAWDAGKKRMAFVLVNFAYRYSYRRQVTLSVDDLPRQLIGGDYRQWTIDATHSNVWNDPSHAELEKTDSGLVAKERLNIELTLEANSVTLLEMSAKPRE
jgi:hypothetical protein